MDTSNYGTNGATSPAKQKFIASAASKSYNGPSIVDYLKASGADSSLAGRSALGSTYGIDFSKTNDNYATQNTALLSALRGGANTGTDAGVGGAGTGSTIGGAPGVGTPSGGAPTAPTPSAADTAFADYLASLKTDNTSAAKTAYNDFIAKRDQGVVGLEGQGRGIPLSLIRGQQSKLYNQAGIEANRLQGDINIAEASQTNTRAANKARYDYEQGKIDAVTKNNPAFELSPGQERYTYDPKTGGYVKSASVDPAYKTVAAGATLYDPNTGKPIYTAPKTYAPKTTSTTKDIIASGEAKLNAARGADGWTDPYLYKEAYDGWVNGKMGTAAQFLTKFPPKNYVNPKATFLPAYLQNKPAKSSGSQTP